MLKAEALLPCLARKEGDGILSPSHSILCLWLLVTFCPQKDLPWRWQCGCQQLSPHSTDIPRQLDLGLGLTEPTWNGPHLLLPWGGGVIFSSTTWVESNKDDSPKGNPSVHPQRRGLVTGARTNSCHYVALSAMVTSVSLLLSFIRVIDKKFQRKNNYW